MSIINKYFSNVYVINMDKDTERMKTVSNTLNTNNITFERFSAVNGAQLDQSERDKYLTKFCDLMVPNSVIGCAISHYKLWQKVVDENLDNVLIFEDDIFFIDNYEDVLKPALDQLPTNWDIFYLGCTGLCDKDKQYKNPFNLLFYLFKNTKQEFHSDNLFVPEYGLSAHAYALSNKGCRKLLSIIKRINHHIDTMIAMNANKLEIYACHPNIAYQRSDDSNIADNGFPTICNNVLSKYKDEKNFKYSYYFTVPVVKYVNMWTIIFLLLGIVSYYNKYVLYCILFMFFLDADLISNGYYLVSLFAFISSLCILHLRHITSKTA